MNLINFIDLNIFFFICRVICLFFMYDGGVSLFELGLFEVGFFWCVC